KLLYELVEGGFAGRLGEVAGERRPHHTVDADVGAPVDAFNLDHAARGYEHADPAAGRPPPPHCGHRPRRRPPPRPARAARPPHPAAASRAAAPGPTARSRSPTRR